MSTQQEANIHRIFILTVWRKEKENWRFLVEDPRSGGRKGFASIVALVEGLLAMVVGEGQRSAPEDEQDLSRRLGMIPWVLNPIADQLHLCKLCLCKEYKEN